MNNKQLILILILVAHFISILSLALNQLSLKDGLRFIAKEQVELRLDINKYFLRSKDMI